MACLNATDPRRLPQGPYRCRSCDAPETTHEQPPSHARAGAPARRAAIAGRSSPPSGDRRYLAAQPGAGGAWRLLDGDPARCAGPTPAGRREARRDAAGAADRAAPEAGHAGSLRPHQPRRQHRGTVLASRAR
ncbi:hypothetical protein G6F22_008209 [Rhizopus arrhizus]|nr:hypothetical protein G6F22_008209 [Rhizopus arrhizus]